MVGLTNLNSLLLALILVSSDSNNLEFERDFESETSDTVGVEAKGGVLGITGIWVFVKEAFRDLRGGSASYESLSVLSEFAQVSESFLFFKFEFYDPTSF